MTGIAETIWDLKYRFKKVDGTPIDQTMDHTHRRIARALAQAEGKDMAPLWENEFYHVLKDFLFMPAGRIIAGAGTGRDVTLFNCYVMGTIPDSMDGIFSSLREAALTMQQGGGIGYDFSTIRPKGAEVVKVGADASGPLSFMDVWDAMCRTVMSAGSRRGAMMATMRCDHPDIMDFITAKKDPTKLRMFNVSVLCTDDFMDAVRENLSWDLVHEVPPRAGMEPTRADGKFTYKTLPAREIWDAIMKNTYAHAEPGVIFIDRINKLNNLNWVEEIAATNPCGEQPLPPYGACLLGSINLAKMIDEPFTEDSTVNMTRLSETVRVAVRMLDNAIDVSNFPLPQQLREAKMKRRIGLGITGLADALMMMDIRYGTTDAADWLDEIMEVIAVVAYETSIDLAKEKGPFPLLDITKHLGTESFLTMRMPQRIIDDVTKHGIRNSHLLSIAPTGTISLYAGNISSGIEPIFAYKANRNILQPDGSKKQVTIYDYAVELWRQLPRHDDLPPAYVDAQTLSPQAHILMQATAQSWVDTSISKTINLPEDIPFKDFENVYWAAYNEGCKGCTTYRPNDVTGSILSVDKHSDQEAIKNAGVLFKQEDPTKDYTPISDLTTPIERPDMLEGKTYKVKFGSMEHALYVTINDHMGQPFELFLASKDVAHQAWMAALSRMTSAVWRRGGDVSFVIEELRAIHDPIGGGWANGKHVPSVQAYIGDIIERHMGNTPKPVALKFTDDRPTKLPLCPKCQQHTLVREEGCEKCLNCEYNKCG